MRLRTGSSKHPYRQSRKQRSGCDRARTGTWRPVALALALISGACYDFSRQLGSGTDPRWSSWYAAPLPDLDGDGLEDLFVAVRDVDSSKGDNAALHALSSATGELLWARRASMPWMSVRLDDVDNDGVGDMAISSAAELCVLSSRGGEFLVRRRRRAPEEAATRALRRIRDLDGDGIRDLALGAPSADSGRVEVVSAASGAMLFELENLFHDPQYGSGLAWREEDGRLLVMSARRYVGWAIDPVPTPELTAQLPPTRMGWAAVALRDCSWIVPKYQHRVPAFVLSGEEQLTPVHCKGLRGWRLEPYSEEHARLISRLDRLVDCKGETMQPIPEDVLQGLRERDPKLLSSFAVTPIGDLDGDGAHDWIIRHNVGGRPCTPRMWRHARVLIVSATTGKTLLEVTWADLEGAT